MAGFALCHVPPRSPDRITMKYRRFRVGELIGMDIHTRSGWRRKIFLEFRASNQEDRTHHEQTNLRRH
jgi:hypothetical protein